MSKKILLHIFTILSLCQLINFAAFCQKTNYAGIGIVPELTGSNDVSAGLTLTLERKITRHSGIESGLLYRTYVQSFYIANNTSFSYFNVKERYLSLPVLYKFYSRIINFSAGPTFDFFIGHKKNYGTYTVDNYSVDPTLAIGFLFKLSKQINLSDRLKLEPELRLNPIANRDMVYSGLGLIAKYRF